MKTIKEIGEICGVSEGAIRSFIKYRSINDMYLPKTIEYAKDKFPELKTNFIYEDKEADILIDLFKSKKRGEMSEFNYKYNYGKKFREKYPKKD